MFEGLDLDHVGTQITQVLGAQRPGQHLGEIYDPYIFESFHRAGLGRDFLTTVRMNGRVAFSGGADGCPGQTGPCCPGHS